MQGAVLIGAQMQRADLHGAQMQGADLSEAQMQGADLSEAQMQGADLSGAQMEGADLSGAQMEGADLSGTQMEGAALHYAQLTGAADDHKILYDTNLSMSIIGGGMLRFVDLTTVQFDETTDFRNAFLDGSVAMTAAFRDQMGQPCQWATEPLNDAAFHARWRGWIEVGPDA
jgi:uncharacterized protein YjbI with pentapeptide repeats